jgi:hypothetical protein
VTAGAAEPTSAARGGPGPSRPPTPPGGANHTDGPGRGAQRPPHPRPPSPQRSHDHIAADTCQPGGSAGNRASHSGATTTTNARSASGRAGQRPNWCRSARRRPARRPSHQPAGHHHPANPRQSPRPCPRTGRHHDLAHAEAKWIVAAGPVGELAIAITALDQLAGVTGLAGSHRNFARSAAPVRRPGVCAGPPSRAGARNAERAQPGEPTGLARAPNSNETLPHCDRRTIRARPLARGYRNHAGRADSGFRPTATKLPRRRHLGRSTEQR